MLTPEQIADGWKPHDGGECPVDGPAAVEVIIRAGIRGVVAPIAIGWDHSRPDRNPLSDIIAYKEQSHDD
jgi:hypothetical protein